ncbi:MAG: hypothetical protein HY298_25725 [Verrucomicrobia bacterium]|nr:hypothetical protein [Verrucomicrobiota bacterium]
MTISAAWLLAWGGYTLASNSKMTAEKLRTYAQSVELGRLTGKARAEAINQLAFKLNALAADERQQARMDGVLQGWLEQMTEVEKTAFIEATMPNGFKEMLSAFEKMSEEKRRRAIGEALKRLKEVRENLRESSPSAPVAATNRAPVITPEVEKRVREIGLKSFYNESSAQTKADLAPILEELQRMMESGAIARGGPK